MSSSEQQLRVTIIAAEAKSAATATEGSIEEKLRAAMRVARKNWLRPPEDEMFVGAVTGVMTYYGKGSEEYEKLREEMMAMRRLSDALAAAQSGIPVNWEQAIPQADEGFIGLRKLWDEGKKGGGCDRRQTC